MIPRSSSFPCKIQPPWNLVVCTTIEQESWRLIFTQPHQIAEWCYKRESHGTYGSCGFPRKNHEIIFKPENSWLKTEKLNMIASVLIDIPLCKSCKNLVLYSYFPRLKVATQRGRYGRDCTTVREVWHKAFEWNHGWIDSAPSTYQLMILIVIYYNLSHLVAESWLAPLDGLLIESTKTAIERVGAYVSINLSHGTSN